MYSLVIEHLLAFASCYGVAKAIWGYFDDEGCVPGESFVINYFKREGFCTVIGVIV